MAPIVTPAQRYSIGLFERSQELAHFSRGVKIALDASGRNTIAKNRASFIDSPEPHELLAGHEKGRHIGWGVARQIGESSQAGVVIAFLIELHRKTVAQKRIGRVIGEHGFDFRAARHWITWWLALLLPPITQSGQGSFFSMDLLLQQSAYDQLMCPMLSRDRG
jgi:hypothetical protein